MGIDFELSGNDECYAIGVQWLPMRHVSSAPQVCMRVERPPEQIIFFTRLLIMLLICILYHS